MVIILILFSLLHKPFIFIFLSPTMRSKYLSKIRIRSFDKISISILFHSLYSLFTKKESSPIYLCIKTFSKLCWSIDSTSFKIFPKNCQSFFWTSAYVYLARRKIQSHRRSKRERFECTRIAFRKWRLDIHSEGRDRGAKLDLALRRREW